MNTAQKLRYSLGATAIMAGNAMAQVAEGPDVSGAVSGIGLVQVAIISIVSAFIGLSVAVLGYNKVSAFLKRKSGA